MFLHIIKSTFNILNSKLVKIYCLLVYGIVTCHFKTFGHSNGHGHFKYLCQGLEMAWPFRNDQLFLLAVLIPHQFDISGQVCFVAFKCNSSNEIKTYVFIRTAFGLL